MSVPAVALTIINKIIGEEGGWQLTQRANDPDIATYGGMRYKSLRDYCQSTRRLVLTVESFVEAAEFDDEELQDLIIECYYEEYYLKGKVDKLHSIYQPMYYSCVVNLGIRGAGKILQATINAANVIDNQMVVVDGAVGPKTIDCLQFVISNYNFRTTFIDEWIRYYINIVQANSLKLLAGETTVNQAMNLEGWFNRATKYRYNG